MPGEIQPTNPKLEAVPDVVIDDHGKFKYIQCKIYDPDKSEDWKLIVRGSNLAEFHSDIYDELDGQLEEQGLMCECLGGGKIQHDATKKEIEVMGNSQGYGKANHAETVRILKRHAVYSTYISITWEGD